MKNNSNVFQIFFLYTAAVFTLRKFILFGRSLKRLQFSLSRNLLPLILLDVLYLIPTLATPYSVKKGKCLSITTSLSCFIRPRKSTFIPYNRLLLIALSKKVLFLFCTAYRMDPGLVALYVQRSLVFSKIQILNLSPLQVPTLKWSLSKRQLPWFSRWLDPVLCS